MDTQKNTSLKVMIPVMMCFFVMGIVDIVGVATNFARKDFQLDSLSVTVLPMMGFLWFAIFSIPTGLLMNKIGRKKTVLSSILITIVALIMPYILYNLYIVVLAFALLGIGNTILQVSLNPLVSSLVNGDKLAGTLTFGQFVKAISAFLAPIIAGFAARQCGDWKLVLVVYAVVSALSFVFLYYTKIAEIPEAKANNEAATFKSTLSMLGDKTIFQLFMGILLVVGIDVCMNTNTPELLIQKLGFATENAGMGSSIYFGARTAGAFLGSFILIRTDVLRFLKINMVIAILAFLMLMFIDEKFVIFAAIVIVGLTCANVFSILFSIALQAKPKFSNEVSSLMIMGVAGGAIVTPIVGLVAKSVGISLSFGVLLLCALYILSLSFKTFKIK